jgi:hypothetical protein
MRRHILAKQHLTPHTAGANSDVIAEDLVGLHDTGTTSRYLQLPARMTGFRRSDLLDQALYHDRAFWTPLNTLSAGAVLSAGRAGMTAAARWGVGEV